MVLPVAAKWGEENKDTLELASDSNTLPGPQITKKTVLCKHLFINNQYYSNQVTTISNQILKLNLKQYLEHNEINLRDQFCYIFFSFHSWIFYLCIFYPI